MHNKLSANCAKIIPVLCLFITHVYIHLLKPTLINRVLRFAKPRGLYTGKYPDPWGGGISADVIWGKKMKRGRENGGKCKTGRKKKKKEERGKQMRRAGRKGEK